MAPTKRSTSTSRGAAASRTAGRKQAAAKKAPAKKAPATSAAAKKAAAKKAAPARAAAKEAAAPVARAAGAAQRTARRASGGSARRGAQQPDAIQLLTDDHRKVEELFTRFEQTGDGAAKRRQDLVRRISEALSVHASVEEEIFYPAVRQQVADAGDDVLEALEEHHLVKLTLAELESMDPSHERYGAKVTVLMENVRHHVEEEEGELFPSVREALDAEQLRDLGAELAAAKRTAPTRPHPEAPDTPPGNVVAQVLTAPLDAAANLNRAAARRVRDNVT